MSLLELNCSCRGLYYLSASLPSSVNFFCAICCFTVISGWLLQIFSANNIPHFHYSMIFFSKIVKVSVWSVLLCSANDSRYIMKRGWVHAFYPLDLGTWVRLFKRCPLYHSLTYRSWRNCDRPNLWRNGHQMANEARWGMVPRRSPESRYTTSPHCDPRINPRPWVGWQIFWRHSWTRNNFDISLFYRNGGQIILTKSDKRSSSLFSPIYRSIWRLGRALLILWMSSSPGVLKV